jgi:hypothetical protein
MGVSAERELAPVAGAIFQPVAENPGTMTSGGNAEAEPNGHYVRGLGDVRVRLIEMDFVALGGQGQGTDDVVGEEHSVGPSVGPPMVDGILALLNHLGQPELRHETRAAPPRLWPRSGGS